MNFIKRLRSESAIRLLSFLLIVNFTVFRPKSVLADPSGGAALFKSKCVMCHGPDGSGNTPIGKAIGTPDLRSAQVQKLSDAQLSAIIIKGKGKMPAFGSSLSKSQTDALVAFIRSLAKKK